VPRRCGSEPMPTDSLEADCREGKVRGPGHDHRAGARRRLGRGDAESARWVGAAAAVRRTSA
jgi:hypothetical protein